MSHFQVIGIPQRETLPDKRLDALIAKHGEMILRPAMTAIAYGRIGSGKTSVLYSILKNMLPHYFDEVVVFCASSDSKDAFESLPQKNILFLTDYDDEAFTNYVNKLREDQIERLSKGKSALNVCVVFDDIVFSNAISRGGRQGSMVERLMLICRHELNCSVLIACQHSKQITPAMRNNTLYHIICGVQRNDLAKIAEEHANHLSHEEFMKMYHQVQASGRHQFILVDYKAPEERRFRHNFDKIITFPNIDGLHRRSEEVNIAGNSPDPGEGSGHNPAHQQNGGKRQRRRKEKG